MTRFELRLSVAMARAIFLVAAVLMGFISTCAYAIEATSLREGTQRYALGKHLSYLEDKEGLLTLDDVMSWKKSEAFIASTVDVPNFSFTQSVYWFRLDLVNQDSSVSEWLMEIQYAPLDLIDAHIVYGPKQIVSSHAGDTLSFSERAVKHRHPIIKVALDKGQAVTVYLRVETTSSLQLPLILWSQQALFSKDHDEQYWLGIYYGIFFAMFFYNLMIFVSIRDKSYFYYLFYVFGFGLFQMSLNGLALEYLWSDSPLWVSFANQFFIGCTGIGITQFSRKFLQLNVTMPKMDLVSRGFLWIFGLLLFLTFLAPVSYVIRIATLASLTQAFLILFAGVFCLVRGVEQAKYFVIAWTLLLVGIIFYTLKTFSVLPTVFITEYSLQIGSAFEVVLLSFALAHRMRLLKDEYERMQKESAVTLEQRVKERTLDLDRALADLSFANEQLKDISHIDGLTGAKNRAYFDEQFGLEWRRAFRRKSRIGLLLIDIDHFKRVNEMYGHLGGDACLKQVAKSVKRSIHRSGDDLFRYGGEQFAVILPDTDTTGCVRVATSVRDAIEKLDILYEGKKIALTVSIGLACVRPTLESTTNNFLIAAADSALYDAKHSGRNRVGVHADSDPSEPAEPQPREMD